MGEMEKKGTERAIFVYMAKGKKTYYCRAVLVCTAKEKKTYCIEQYLFVQRRKKNLFP